MVITHGISNVPPEALTKRRKICYSPHRDEIADDRTNCAAAPFGTHSAGHRIDCGSPAVGGGESAAQGRESQRATATPDVAQLLAAPVAGCETQPSGEPQTPEARPTLWA